ncbi:hypothetical protein BP5796_00741 [Coleophoma crateriformis]|uniref:Altered inheritance of mitochondria protein 6 n=1 Tax=Coleophoma crateriformis TaxID=565419 RepID=A0A3D8TAQ5_9HELO|nr:hypothetical protein BP5796_00741 [Coleophoma crateriformis]
MSLMVAHGTDSFEPSARSPIRRTASPLSSISSDSTQIDTAHRPMLAFEHDKEADGGFERKPTRPRRQHWWSLPTRSSARYTDVVDQDRIEHGNGLPAPGLMADMMPRRRKPRSLFNYFVFGGLSGCTVLLLLMATNLILGVATLFWADGIDRILEDWGKPGTGTEGLAWYPTDFTRDINPIPCHSHNDYWRRVPLFSALRAGCTGVEADVWLIDDELYVGHNTASLTRNRTFQSLYVLPLVQLLDKQNPNTDFYNGTTHGVFDTDPGKSVTLLIDVKTSGPETWPWVLQQLEPLRERGWLTFVENNSLHPRPVTVVGTGNTPFDVLTANSTYRDAFFDAPLNDMWEGRTVTSENKDWPSMDDSGPGEALHEEEGSAEEDLAMGNAPQPVSSLVPTEQQDAGQGHSGIKPNTEFTPLNSYYASVSFNSAVGRMWRGRLSPRQMKIIRGQVRGAHRRGLKVRYWDLPSWPLGLRNHVWDVLIKEGVDYLNVDDLRAASKQVW